jgi:hypothetical protein
VPGYPLGAYFDTPYSYADANGNGIIEPNEITFGSHRVYFGTQYPPTNITLATAVGLFSNRLHISVQVDHRGGLTTPDVVGGDRCIYYSACQGVADPHASLASQAGAQALLASGFQDYAGYYRDGSFTRLREVAVTYTLPSAAAHAVRAHEASITLSGRNLAVWTRYTGADPEVNGSITSSPVLGAYSDSGGLPPAQYWLARVNLTF